MTRAGKPRVLAVGLAFARALAAAAGLIAATAGPLFLAMPIQRRWTEPMVAPKTPSSQRGHRARATNLRQGF
jgi:hypothetical protein